MTYVEGGFKMIYFRSDYSLGAHPKVMEALMETNMEHTDGYAEDRFSFETADMIREMIGRPDAHIHFLVGGTPTNTITIAAALRPYEGAISAASGHIYVHETGSVEATGHRVFAAPTEDGKLRPADIEKIMLLHEDEHTVIPKLVYITHPTENGGVYTKAELKALRECCDKHGLYLYMDGARLGTALTWPGNDVPLSDLPELTDAFYIGGTKIGTLFGEALVILNDVILNIKAYGQVTVKVDVSVLIAVRIGNQSVLGNNGVVCCRDVLIGKDAKLNILDLVIHSDAESFVLFEFFYKRNRYFLPVIKQI